MLLIICVERLLHIGSNFSLRKWRWRPHFPTKLVAAASFSHKIGGGGKDLATLLVAVLTWSGYWYTPSYIPRVKTEKVPSIPQSWEHPFETGFWVWNNVLFQFFEHDLEMFYQIIIHHQASFKGVFYK